MVADSKPEFVEKRILVTRRPFVTVTYAFPLLYSSNSDVGTIAAKNRGLVKVRVKGHTCHGVLEYSRQLDKNELHAPPIEPFTFASEGLVSETAISRYVL
jgi:hypothetical protein